MKKLICLLLSLMMLLGAAACAEPAPVENCLPPERILRKRRAFSCR